MCIRDRFLGGWARAIASGYPTKLRFFILSRLVLPSLATFFNTLLGIEPIQQLANFHRVIGAQNLLSKYGDFRQAGGEHTLLDARHLRREHGELAQTKAQQ